MLPVERVMKLRNLLLILAIACLLPALAVAKDSDKQKLIDIEKEFADQPNAGPEAVQLIKKHFYNGTVNELTPSGRILRLSKSELADLFSKPDASDPDAKTSESVSDFQVDFYADTALISFKTTSTDTGHKDPALNVTHHFSCLETFVKRQREWYEIGTACASNQHLSQSEPAH
jgi:hypothetical protein